MDAPFGILDQGLWTFPNSNFNIYKFHVYCMHTSDTVKSEKIQKKCLTFLSDLQTNVIGIIDLA